MSLVVVVVPLVELGLVNGVPRAGDLGRLGPRVRRHLGRRRFRLAHCSGCRRGRYRALGDERRGKGGRTGAVVGGTAPGGEAKPDELGWVAVAQPAHARIANMTATRIPLRQVMGFLLARSWLVKRRAIPFAASSRSPRQFRLKSKFWTWIAYPFAGTVTSAYAT